MNENEKLNITKMSELLNVSDDESTDISQIENDSFSIPDELTFNGSIKGFVNCIELKELKNDVKANILVEDLQKAKGLYLEYVFPANLNISEARDLIKVLEYLQLHSRNDLELKINSKSDEKLEGNKVIYKVLLTGIS